MEVEAPHKPIGVGPGVYFMFPCTGEHMGASFAPDFSGGLPLVETLLDSFGGFGTDWDGDIFGGLVPPLIGPTRP